MTSSKAPGPNAKHSWSTIARVGPPKRSAQERAADFAEIYGSYDEATVREQASRCIQCPDALCAQGCPLSNRIPEWLALAAALLSTLTGVRLRPRVAMTGEITLSGRILRIGGLKETCLAAVRTGVSTVILPETNRASLRELPDELTSKLHFVFVERFVEALPHILA